ncbi:protein kinase [Kineosporia rhizophila]|uniref:protein kinase domain-containing protein n=1 Tax=Kineosporia rhizophila TaxID=84633 RepID=UPI001E3E1146|nr:protein kinase [Kineosporia rhizophila]
MSTSDEEPKTVRQRPEDLPQVRHGGEEPTVVQTPAGGPADHEDPTVIQLPADQTPVIDLRAHEAPTLVQPVPGAARSGAGSSGLPAALAVRFELRPGPNGSPALGAGGEADVWLAQDSENDCLVALKVYRGQAEDFDERVRRDLEARRNELGDEVFRRHVPRLYGWGTVPHGGRDVAWEAMEYLPDGSLADLIRSARPGVLPAGQAEQVVAALVETLDFWEREKLGRQIDLSPGNVLLRRGEPLELVLGDFGGVKGTGLSQAFGILQVKLAYMAPEALSSASHAKSPFWSLGMIVHEMVTGATVLAGQDENVHRLLLATDDIDVSGITDQRWRTLVEGLLTRGLSDRWGAVEVRKWLAREQVPVRRSTRDRSRMEQLSFNGNSFDDPRLLVAELVTHPDQAISWLRRGGSGRLDGWLRRTFPDQPFDTARLAGLGRDEVSAHLVLAHLGAAFLRDVQPLYRGQAIDTAGLLRLARDPSRHALLHEIVDSGVLGIAARHNCEHPGCTGRCRRLDQLAEDIPQAVRFFERRLDEVTTTLRLDPLVAAAFGGWVDTTVNASAAIARITEMLIDPATTAALRQRAQSTRLPRQPWWTELERTAKNPRGNRAERTAAVAIIEHLMDLARRYRLADDQRRQVSRRQNAARAGRWTLSQFTGTPTGGRVFSAPRPVMFLLWIALLASTYEPAYLLVAKRNALPRDQAFMAAAEEVMAETHLYTQGIPDWMTPVLRGVFPGPAWKALIAYPVVVAVCIVVIRRSTRGSGARSWMVLPAATLGALTAIGLIMHLLATDFRGFWVAMATLDGEAIGIMLVVWIAVRVAAGPRRAPVRPPTQGWGT